MLIVDDKWEPAKGATPEDYKALADNLADASEAIYQARKALHSVIPGEAWEIVSNALEASMHLIVDARMKCHVLEQRDRKSGE
ncbi:hypothetical protein [Paraburkholderia bryophila]|uniref:Uncharacterized protein n=1 Tax=Paraburkholderia bryophila TaxID=420952 RepID=A0A7Y9W3D5_9BURK|nr:hypothetical protein [Paraburkholderia bryophila]NYH13541.1 hypothetical protein [Paraburkholderia bryophila]